MIRGKTKQYLGIVSLVKKKNVLNRHDVKHFKEKIKNRQQQNRSQLSILFHTKHSSRLFFK